MTTTSTDCLIVLVYIDYTTLKMEEFVSFKAQHKFFKEHPLSYVYQTVLMGAHDTFAMYISFSDLLLVVRSDFLGLQVVICWCPLHPYHLITYTLNKCMIFNSLECMMKRKYDASATEYHPKQQRRQGHSYNQLFMSLKHLFESH